MSLERDGTMTNDKPLKILLIEDDATDCRNFLDCASKRTDITFIGMTPSSDEGLRLVKTHLPECVILDLELSKGKGTGLQFLLDLQKSELSLRPIVVVTTNIQSEVMYDNIHNMGVTFVFSKKQSGYSPEMVIDTLLCLRNSLPSAQKDNIHKDLQTIESPEDLHSRIIERIDAELNQVGISARLKGRQYLREAIYLLIIIEKNQSDAIIYQVADQNKITYNSAFFTLDHPLSYLFVISRSIMLVVE